MLLDDISAIVLSEESDADKIEKIRSLLKKDKTHQLPDAFISYTDFSFNDARIHKLKDRLLWGREVEKVEILSVNLAKLNDNGRIIGESEFRINGEPFLFNRETGNVLRKSFHLENDHGEMELILFFAFELKALRIEVPSEYLIEPDGQRMKPYPRVTLRFHYKG